MESERKIKYLALFRFHKELYWRWENRRLNCEGEQNGYFLVIGIGSQILKKMNNQAKGGPLEIEFFEGG